MSEGNAEIYDTERTLTKSRYVLEETLRLSEAHGIGHKEVISVTQLAHLLLTKSLGVETVVGEPKFPLCELVANEVATYEQSTGRNVPENLLDEYGWSREELGDMVEEMGQKPILRIVPKEYPVPEPEEKIVHAKPLPPKEGESLPDPEDDIRNYLRDINAPGMPKYHKMSKEAQQELVARMLKGEPGAAFEMVTANLNLVVSVAKNFRGRGATLLELITYGNEGLIKAASPRYDPSQAQFSTYASWWIKQSIRRGLLNEQKTVRIPAYMIELIVKYRRFSKKFIKKHDNTPTVEDVAVRFGGKMPKAKRIAKAKLIMKSSDQINRNIKMPEWKKREETQYLEDMPAPEGDVSTADYADVDRIDPLLEKNLSEREELIMRLRYGIGTNEPMTLEDIGKRISLTRERVRQIEAVALRKLKVACGVIGQSDLSAYMRKQSDRQRENKQKRMEEKE